MTISSPNFTRLQDGVKSVDDLRVRGPLNVALAYLSGSLVTQLNSHFDAISQSVSTQITTRLNAFLATANTWTAAQTITLTAAGAAVNLQSTDAGAGSGPNIFMYRNSATPAISDILSILQFNGNNSVGTSTPYGLIFSQIIDPTDGSEDGRIVIRSIGAGAGLDWYFQSGAIRYSSQTQPTNPGEIAAVAYKVGASQVVGARVTGWGDPFGASSRATFSTTTATANQVAQALAALITDLKTHGVIGT
jgi:hypothetical protein